MRDVLDRIDEWERSGLIDADTAGRLRSAEAGRADSDTHAAPEPAPATAERPRGLAFSSVFGPGVTVGEMFAYLGVGFLVAAWSAFVVRLSGDAADAPSVGLGFGVAAVALAALGVVLRSGDARRRRAAGVAFLAATGFAAAATGGLAADWTIDGRSIALLVTAVALLVAAVFRRLHPALLTEFGFLSAATSLGAALMSWIEGRITPQFDGFNGPEVGTFDAVPLVLAQAAGWLVIALLLGLYALAVVRADEGDEAAAHRRATLVRAWAGLVAVLGLTTTLTRQTYLADDYQRVIPVWAADLAILALALVLVERAFRRDSGAFLLAAGVGFIAALTDFNFSYLTTSTEVGLLVEGVILLGVGFVADRLRRRLSAEEPRDLEVEAATLR